MTKIVTTADGLHTGTLHKVRGTYMTESGYINDMLPRSMFVIVDAEGAAWPHLYEETIYNSDEHGNLEPLAAEVWGDGIYLGRQFSPAEGEFERCGIKFTLCGSAAV